MKRCPECGFRANDTVCPLCGVRMQGYSAPISTHTHRQGGEKCVLPNRENPKTDVPKNETYNPQRNTTRRSTPSGTAIAIIVIVLISVLKNCPKRWVELTEAGISCIIHLVCVSVYPPSVPALQGSGIV